MPIPPPLPRQPQRIPASVLIAIVLLLLAVAARVMLTLSDPLYATPFGRLVLAAGGMLVAGGAAFFGVVALLLRRRFWILSVFLIVAGISVGALLTGELQQHVAALAAKISESSGEGMDLGKRPLPQAGPTEAELKPAVVAWGEEKLVRPYLDHAHPETAWDEAAKQFIRGTVLEMALPSASPGWAHLRAQGAELLRVGCDDPWVLFLIHRMGENDPDFPEAMAKASSTLTAAGYPPFALWLARAETLRGLRRDAPSEAPAAMKDCQEAFRDALSAKPLDVGDYSAWGFLFTSETGQGFLEQNGEEVCRVADSIPGIQEWFRWWLRGRSEFDQAWLARGTGYANTISEEQWKGFGQHLAASRMALSRAQNLDPSQPAIARAMMQLERGSSRPEEIRNQFDRLIQLRFDYSGAYGEMRYCLLPRWFGSHEALLAFGRECLATNRFDTVVPFQMVRAVRGVADEQPDLDQYYKTAAPWDDLMKTLDGYLAHGDPARRRYYLSEKAVLAVKRGLPPLADQLLKELDYKIDPEVISEWNLPVQWVGWVATYCGPAHDLILRAENEEERHPEKSVESLLAAQKLPGLPPVVKVYLERRTAQIQAVIALNAAPWHPLTPPQDLAGWKVEGGKWHVASNSVLEMKTEDTGALLTQLQTIGDTWELRGELALANRSPGRAEAAIFCGPPGAPAKAGFSLRFWTNVNGGEGISLARGFREDAFSKTIDFTEPTPFLICFANQRVWVTANNVRWLADQPLPEGLEIGKDAVLGLGSTVGGKTVQFRKLEWRTPVKAN